MTVPLLNQPYTLLAITPLALIQCHCNAHKGASTLLQIFGVRNTVLCPNCGKSYMITNPATGEIAMFPAASPSGLVQ